MKVPSIGDLQECILGNIIQYSTAIAWHAIALAASWTVRAKPSVTHVLLTTGSSHNNADAGMSFRK
jgi:hypothetical protein